MYIFSLVFSFIFLLSARLTEAVEIDENETPVSELPCLRLDCEKNATTFSVIPPETKLCVDVSDISTKVRFMVVEAHSQRYNVTISYLDENPALQTLRSSPNSVEGTGVGLVYMLDVPGDRTFWLTNYDSNSVRVMISIELYYEKDPIPGACNMEFPVEISPFLRTRLQQGFTVLEFQHANVGYPPGFSPPSCSLAVNYMIYDIYLLFLSENDFDETEYFNGLQLMREVESIKKYGTLLKPYSVSPRTRMHFMSYPGQGVIYNIIASYQLNGSIYESAYVPLATYGCSFQSEVDGCGHLTNSLARFFALFVAVVGLFIGIRGHRFLTIEMAYFGFLVCALIAFILLTKYSSVPRSDRDVFTMIIGLGGAIVWALVWWFFGIPVVSVLLVGFCLGFLLTATLYFTPLGNVELLHNDFNYWMLFSCGILIIPVVFLSSTKFLNILACSVVGTYGTVVAIDRYLGSTITYVVLNVVKRAVVEDSNLASNEVPFKKIDTVLCCTWAVLATFGVALQLYTERGRPPFPPAPIVLRRREMELRRQRSRRLRYRNNREILPSTEEVLASDEREPLLSRSPNLQYSSTS